MTAAPGERNDPALIHKFYLEIEGVVVAEFTEMGGFSAERETKQYPEGGINDHVRMLPGRVKYGNVTLKRGLTYSHELWNWFQEGAYDGKVKRVNASIILGDAAGLRVKQWDLTGAFPTKYRSSDLKAGGTELTIETLELAHEGVTLNAGATKSHM
jgi:phage tail-like protein